MTKPWVGAPAHYVSDGTPGGEDPSVCRAAVITAVSPDNNRLAPHGPWVDLCVLNPEGLFFTRGVIYDEIHRGGTWHWPERA